MDEGGWSTSSSVDDDDDDDEDDVEAMLRSVGGA
jgi:hypothetical protein